MTELPMTMAHLAQLCCFLSMLLTSFPFLDFMFNACSLSIFKIRMFFMFTEASSETAFEIQRMNSECAN